MVDGIDAVWAFLTAALITLLLVRPAERLARRVDAIDEPGPRSQHTDPTPRMSGLAILAGIQV
ncbi:MAG TPA: undecaprenyl/decaprenyl-phosphate alpha-N-acetylglucosaminyl 1-phosphate transferase, partial [Solirubrobacterales bacterium]|nr:undecaprenyl/decaprenyl-phosphate alpha-N-acetylglucosaminyl 1-phosphate transferase [Solirubrobacterales bacterium]